MPRSIIRPEIAEDHPSSNELIEFVAGRLDFEASEKVELHLSRCETCCSSLADLDRNAQINLAIRSAVASDRQFNQERITLTNQSFASKSADERYQTIEEIDRGGMGVVLRVRDQHLGREVALKTIRPDADSPAARQRFAKEARIAARLNHPGIPPVHDLGEFSDGLPFMAMKLVRGQTLASRISDDGGVHSLIPAFVKLCECIGYAHSHGIIHRDLKPHNVMVGEFGEVQVMDWGLAKQLELGVLTKNDHAKTVDLDHISKKPARTGLDFASDTAGMQGDQKNLSTINDGAVSTPKSDRTLAGSIIGTPAYMSPEQANGKIREIDQRSDVFGLGAILCEILTGKPPYSHSDFSTVQTHAEENNLDLAQAALEQSEAPSELKLLALRCLSREKHDRPDNGTSVAKTVVAWQESVAAQLRSSELEKASQAVRINEEIRRRRIQTALVAVILGFTVAGGFLWSTIQRQRQNIADKLESENSTKIAEANGDLKLLQRSLQAAFENFPNDAQDWKEAERLKNEISRVVAQVPNEQLLNSFNKSQSELVSMREASQADKQLLEDLSVLDGLAKPGRLRGVRPSSTGVSKSGGHTRQQVIERSRLDSNSAVLAFTNYAFDPATCSPKIAAEYFLERPTSFQKELRRWVEIWMHYAKVGQSHADAKWACSLLNFLDDDPVRKRIRAAIINHDVDYLEGVADLPSLESHPPELLWSVGSLLRKSSHEKSKQLIQLALLHHIESSIINRDIARRLQREGRIAEATIHLMLSAASQTNPSKQARELMHVADLFINQGDNIQGAILLRQAMSLSPNIIPEARFCRNISATDAEFAARTLKAMISSGELTRAESWVEMGDALQELERFSEAADAFGKALELGVSRPGKKAKAMHGLFECESALLNQDQ